jgi:hypothetical protein
MILGVQGPHHLGHVLNLAGIGLVRKVNGQAIDHDPILRPHGFHLVLIDEFFSESPNVALIEADFGDFEAHALR